MSNPDKKRVLIVDDAVVVRKVLAEALARDPALEIAGTASNGRLALTKYSSLRPDVVLLDIEMPEMNGLETIPELRKLDPRVPIIMFSTLTEKGAAATLDALTLGATDYVTKPSNTDVDATAESITRELIPKIKALCRIPGSLQTLVAAHHAAAPPVFPRPPRPRSIRTRPQIVTIGVSTGGPEALAVVLSALPAGFPLPVVVAQHMPPVFTSLLAARLSTKCQIPVEEGKNGQRLEASHIWIAPGDYHMEVYEDHGSVYIRTHQGARENFCRPSVDVLFRSVATVYNGSTLGVILTGMGQDGLKGCELLSGRGAQILVQDEATSVVWGMPGFVARAGLADKILPLREVGSEIVKAATTAISVAARKSH